MRFLPFNMSNVDYMIGALQKILSKTTEPDTKNGVEEYVLFDCYQFT